MVHTSPWRHTVAEKSANGLLNVCELEHGPSCEFGRLGSSGANQGRRRRGAVGGSIGASDFGSCSLRLQKIG